MYKITLSVCFLTMYCISAQAMKRSGFTDSEKIISEKKFINLDWNSEWYLTTYYGNIQKIVPFIKESTLSFYSKLLKEEVKELSIKYEEIVNAHETILSYFYNSKAAYTLTIQNNLNAINDFDKLIIDLMPNLKNEMKKQYKAELAQSLERADYERLRCVVKKSLFFNPITTSLKHPSNNILYPPVHYMLTTISLPNSSQCSNKEQVLECLSLLLFVTNNNNINDFFIKYESYMTGIGLTEQEVVDRINILQKE